MRLFDRLVDHGGIFSDSQLDTMRFIADDVAAAIDALPTNNTPAANDYGVLAPPFNEFWIESRSTAPTGLVIERGMYFNLSKIKSAEKPIGTRWQLFGTCYWYESQMIGVGTGCVLINIGDDGVLLDDPEHQPITEPFLDAPRGTVAMDASHAARFTPVCLKAISLLHARTDIDHITPNRQQQRKRAREGSRPLADHYFLRVGPNASSTFRDVAPVAADSRKSKNRQHTVRGHFRYYSPDAPLFGHTSGMVWIPDHDRGSGNDVSKTYVIKPD